MSEFLYSPKEVSKILGISVKTLQSWDSAGKITIVRTPTNRRKVPKSEIDRILGVADSESMPSSRKLAIYGRVSSGEQKLKGDLDRQIESIKSKLNLQIYDKISIITDVGSGLSDRRKGLLKLMKQAQDKEITDIAIRYKDRLTRFGYNYLQFFFQSHNVRIHVLDENYKEKTVYEELTDDLISIVTSFSGKIYGTRSGKNKVFKEKVKGAIEDAVNLPD
jgi:putative resolvase